jgi:hypothetical protein
VILVPAGAGGCNTHKPHVTAHECYSVQKALDEACKKTSTPGELDDIALERLFQDKVVLRALSGLSPHKYERWCNGSGRESLAGSIHLRSAHVRNQLVAMVSIGALHWPCETGYACALGHRRISAPIVPPRATAHRYHPCLPPPRAPLCRAALR